MPPRRPAAQILEKSAARCQPSVEPVDVPGASPTPGGLPGAAPGAAPGVAGGTARTTIRGAGAGPGIPLVQAAVREQRAEGALPFAGRRAIDRVAGQRTGEQSVQFERHVP